MIKQLFSKARILFILLAISSVSVFAAEKTTVKDLICEYHTNPIGIDVQKPRLSWQIESTAQNVLQTAYEIKVTDQSGKLLWTTGKVNSDQSVDVV